MFTTPVIIISLHSVSSAIRFVSLYLCSNICYCVGRGRGRVLIDAVGKLHEQERLVNAIHLLALPAVAVNNLPLFNEHLSAEIIRTVSFFFFLCLNACIKS